ncbi:MAG: DNA alkylation repair protein [bacterium]|nr:DNA alkylation repair protein [bacterium]
MTQKEARAEGIAVLIEARLRAVCTVERAEKEKAYLKSDLEFIGATVPAIRKVVRATLAEHESLERDQLIELVEQLWVQRIHELRRSAVEILEAHVTDLRGGDIGVLERLIRDSYTWALVDNLAACVVGPLLERHPDLEREMDRWSGDDDFWIRRSSLLAHLLPLRRGEGDFERFCRYAEPMLEEREFFIRKAIGWVLRETSRKRPEMVAVWVEDRVGRMAGLTLREAIRHLPDETKERLMGLYRARPKT